MLKILFIHEVSYRKKVIFEMHEFPELLALRGHEISFLEFDEGRKFWKKPNAPRFETVKGRVHSDATINVSRPLQLGIPGLDRLLATITVLPVLGKLFKEGSFDAVVLYAVPTYGLQALWLARRFSVPLLFRALDVSHKIRSSLLSPVIKLVEKRIYNRVDLLSANNPAMVKYCIALGKRTKPTKVHVPPLDVDHFKFVNRDLELRRSLGFRDDDTVLVYMGSFFYFSGLLDALNEFAETSKSSSHLKFLLIGGGEQDSELRQNVEDLGLSERVIFTGFVSYEELPRYLKTADVAVNTLEPTLVANVALPNKVLQYMAAGLPIVSVNLEGLQAIFGSEASILWEKDAASVIKKAARLGDSKLMGMLSETSKLGGLKDFSPDQAVRALEIEIQSLVGEARF